MGTRYHLCAEINWLIEQQKQLDNPVLRAYPSKSYALIALIGARNDGHKFVSFGDCPNFDSYRGVCPGHPYKKEGVLAQKAGE